MTTQYLTANQSTFKSLQSFNSLDELNESIKYAFKNFSNYMTATTKKILGLLSKYSVKYLGVSMLAKSTIADELNVDIRTVRRSFRLLESLGLITSYRLKRATGDRRESSSAIVLTKLISINVLPVVLANKQDINLKDLKTTNDTEAVVKNVDNDFLIKKGLVTKLPPTLQHSLAPFFDVDKLYELSGIVFKAKASVSKDIRIEDHEQKYYNAILSVINAFKRGKARNFEGLLCHAVKAVTRSIWLKDRFNHYMA